MSALDDHVHRIQTLFPFNLSSTVTNQTEKRENYSSAV